MLSIKPISDNDLVEVSGYLDSSSVTMTSSMFFKRLASDILGQDNDTIYKPFRNPHYKLISEFIQSGQAKSIHKIVCLCPSNKNGQFITHVIVVDDEDRIVLDYYRDNLPMYSPETKQYRRLNNTLTSNLYYSNVREVEISEFIENFEIDLDIGY